MRCIWAEDHAARANTPELDAYRGLCRTSISTNKNGRDRSLPWL